MEGIIYDMVDMIDMIVEIKRDAMRRHAMRCDVMQQIFEKKKKAPLKHTEELRFARTAELSP